jgi:hypothetical protein
VRNVGTGGRAALQGRVINEVKTTKPRSGARMQSTAQAVGSASVPGNPPKTEPTGKGTTSSRTASRRVQEPGFSRWGTESASATGQTRITFSQYACWRGTVVFSRKRKPTCHLERSMPTSEANRHAQSKDPYPAQRSRGRLREFSRRPGFSVLCPPPSSGCGKTRSVCITVEERPFQGNVKHVESAWASAPVVAVASRVPHFSRVLCERSGDFRATSPTIHRKRKTRPARAAPISTPIKTMPTQPKVVPHSK